MRARRPYLYSDTRGGIKFALTREVLANHLDTITARNEENLFEKFAQKLAAVDVAPYLPSFITGLCSRSGPFWTGLQTRSG